MTLSTEIKTNIFLDLLGELKELEKCQHAILQKKKARLSKCPFPEKAVVLNVLKKLTEKIAKVEVY